MRKIILVGIGVLGRSEKSNDELFGDEWYQDARDVKRGEWMKDGVKSKDQFKTEANSYIKTAKSQLNKHLHELSPSKKIRAKCTIQRVEEKLACE